MNDQETQSTPAPVAGSGFRSVRLDEVIEPGDEFLLVGCTSGWAAVHDSVGRTVRQQRARENNQAWDFRRPSAPNTEASDGRKVENE